MIFDNYNDQETEITDSMGRTIYVFHGYYVQHGGSLVNCSSKATFEEGMNIETLVDDDCFQWGSPIKCLDDLIEAVYS